MELDRLTQMVSFPGEVETHVGAKCFSSEGGEAFRMRTNGRKKHCKHMNTNEKLLLESQSVVCGEIPGKNYGHSLENEYKKARFWFCF